MAKTKHLQVRMSQRAISQELIEFVLQWGETVDDGRVILSRKSVLALLSSLNRLKQVAQRALEKNGVVVVQRGKTLITTYPLHD